MHIQNTQLCYLFIYLFFTFQNMLFETWFQTHFLHYEYFKHGFSQHFLNHSFHIILNNNTLNLLPHRS